MTFKELLNRHPWAAVKYRLLELYPDEADSIDAYALVYDALILLSPRPSDMHLIVEEVFRPGLDDQPFVDVSGCNGTLQKDLKEFEHFGVPADSECANAEVSYAIEFTPWEEWLGMEVDPATLEAFDEVAIIAHCLWEMTFAGFDQETIQQKVDELRETAAEIRGMTMAERRERCRPFDALDLGEEPADGDAREGKALE